MTVLIAANFTKSLGRLAGQGDQALRETRRETPTWRTPNMNVPGGERHAAIEDRSSLKNFWCVSTLCVRPFKYEPRRLAQVYSQSSEGEGSVRQPVLVHVHVPRLEVDGRARKAFSKWPARSLSARNYEDYKRQLAKRRLARCQAYASTLVSWRLERPDQWGGPPTQAALLEEPPTEDPGLRFR